MAMHTVKSWEKLNLFVNTCGEFYPILHWIYTKNKLMSNKIRWMSINLFNSASSSPAPSFILLTRWIIGLYIQYIHSYELCNYINSFVSPLNTVAESTSDDIPVSVIYWIFVNNFLPRGQVSPLPRGRILTQTSLNSQTLKSTVTVYSCTDKYKEINSELYWYIHRQVQRDKFRIVLVYSQT